jgi:diguanylate cyclase (GGDEF)-like protein
VLCDPLTGLLNRRWLPRFARRLGRAGGGADAAAILLDVDGLKAVNDRLGHPEGDRRLVRIARALARAAGRGRPVVRLGGDEFLVPLAGWARPAACTLAGVLLQAARATGMQVSAGVAIRRAGARRAGLEPMIAAADRALRRAKAAGGNCARWSWA